MTDSCSKFSPAPALFIRAHLSHLLAPFAERSVSWQQRRLQVREVSFSETEMSLKTLLVKGSRSWKRDIKGSPTQQMKESYLRTFSCLLSVRRKINCLVFDLLNFLQPLFQREKALRIKMQKLLQQRTKILRCWENI